MIENMLNKRYSFAAIGEAEEYPSEVDQEKC